MSTKKKQTKQTDTVEATEIMGEFDPQAADMAEAQDVLTAALEELNEAEIDLPDGEEYTDDALTENSVRLYLKEIGKIPMLTEERVIELAKIIAAAKPYAADAEIRSETEPDPNAPPKSPEEIQKLLDDAQKAKDELVTGNLRLVVANAKKLIGQSLPLQDLIQEGSIGLMKAADRFDWTQGFQFSTYATWWVRQAMLRAIANLSGTIRRPVHMRDKLNRIGKFKQAFYQENGRDPTPKEIAQGLNITAEEVARALADVSVVTSLDAPVGGEDSDSNLGDILADTESESPVEAVNSEMMRRAIMQALNKLDSREADVLKLRYGLVDGTVHTLEEIGDVFDITRERIRQIEKKALKKLRVQGAANNLRAFYCN